MPAKEWYTSGQTIRLDEPVIHIARYLARRYRVTLQQLVEALLVSCAERDAAARADPAHTENVDGPVLVPAPTYAPTRRVRGKVIDLRVAQQRRQERAQQAATQPGQ